MSSDPELDEGELPIDVVHDLLPLYRAGAVRAGTRAAVRAYLAAHPELLLLEAEATEAMPLPPELEFRSLRRTHRLLALQRWFFGLAIACFALTLSLQIDRAPDGPPHLQFLLFSHPAWIAPFLPAGVAFWVGYILLRRRVRGG
ncbi:MAG: hypothetical protein ACJ798_09000 [Phenylobacterium sp.]